MDKVEGIQEAEIMQEKKTLNFRFIESDRNIETVLTIHEDNMPIIAEILKELLEAKGVECTITTNKLK